MYTLVYLPNDESESVLLLWAPLGTSMNIQYVLSIFPSICYAQKSAKKLKYSIPKRFSTWMRWKEKMIKADRDT